MKNQNQWYVQVSGQSYGPYTMAQMVAYIGEGRIIANSLISQDPAHGYGMAVGFPVFAGQLTPYASPQVLQQAHAQNQLQPHHAPSLAAAPAPVAAPVIETAVPLVPISPLASAPKKITASAAASAENLFLVMAEISSENRMQFLQLLQDIGTPQRIGETNWVLQAAIDIDDIRNSLAAVLTRQDRLFIMDSVNNRTAWFNIGTETAKKIKRLWNAH